MDTEITPRTEDAPEVPPRVARIILTEDRERMVPLKWPVEFDGKVWDQVRIRRITARELWDFATKASNSPVFLMPPVVDCPLEVWEAMDADDQADIDEAAIEFMPKRLRAAAEALMAQAMQPSQVAKQEN